MIVVMHKTNPLHMYMQQFCPLSAMKQPWIYLYRFVAHMEASIAAIARTPPKEAETAIPVAPLGGATPSGSGVGGSVGRSVGVTGGALSNSLSKQTISPQASGINLQSVALSNLQLSCSLVGHPPQQGFAAQHSSIWSCIAPGGAH